MSCIILATVNFVCVGGGGVCVCVCGVGGGGGSTYAAPQEPSVITRVGLFKAGLS